MGSKKKTTAGKRPGMAARAAGRKGVPAAKKGKPAPAKAAAAASPSGRGGEESARVRKTALSAATLRKMKEILLDHKERIMRDFMHLRDTHLHSSHKEATGDLSGYSLHPADTATDTYDREFALSVASSEGDILYRIDHALARIKDRTYGICEGCGAPIKIGRLNAVPWARLCIACKSAEESGGGGDV